MDEDVVRLAGMGSPADLRFRPRWNAWWVVLHIRYDMGQLTQDQLLNIILQGGFSAGVGERRPEKSGDNFGMFRIASPAEAAKFERELSDDAA